jgi:hypothetical protein
MADKDLEKGTRKPGKTRKRGRKTQKTPKTPEKRGKIVVYKIVNPIIY